MRQSAGFRGARPDAAVRARARSPSSARATTATKYGNWISAQALAARDGRPRAPGQPARRAACWASPRIAAWSTSTSRSTSWSSPCPPPGSRRRSTTRWPPARGRSSAITAGFAELGADGAARAGRGRRAACARPAPCCSARTASAWPTPATRLQLATTPLPRRARSASSPRAATSRSSSGLFLEERGLGLSRFASLGNQADLTAADLAARLRRARGHRGDRRLLRGLPRRARVRRRRRRRGRRGQARGAAHRRREPRVRAQRALPHRRADHATPRWSTRPAARPGIDRVRSPREMADLLARRCTPAGPRGRPRRR